MTHKATFAMNCFWAPQDFFSKISGVLNTVVGYSGGTKENPTYTDLVDHTETLDIEFDPEQVTYEALLKHFFNEHDSTSQQSIQYRSLIFYHSDEQKQSAEQAKADYAHECGKPVLTEILEASTFYPAEEYHQHYLAKARGEYEPASS